MSESSPAVCSLTFPLRPPFHCLVIEFDHASAEAVLGECVCVSVDVFANRFYNFLCQTTLSADLEAVTVIKELITSK